MRELSNDSLSRTKQAFRYDHTDDSFVISTEQDVTETLEVNKAVANQFDERTPWVGDMHRVASIPMVVYMDLVRKGIASDDAALRRWLDDRDNRLWRTRPGKLSR